MKWKNTHVIAIPEEKEQGIDNLFEKMMIENSLTWGAENHASSGSTESPNQDEPKEAYSKTHHN